MRIRSKALEPRFRAFWETSVPLRVLAEELMCTEACLSVWAKDLALPPRKNRKYQIRCTGNLIPRGGSYMQKEADDRGITIGELERRLVHAIIDGRLVNAVLDDGDDDMRKAA